MVLSTKGDTAHAEQNAISSIAMICVLCFVCAAVAGQVAWLALAASEQAKNAQRVAAAGSLWDPHASDSALFL